MKNSWCFFRSILVLLIAGNLLLSPALPVYARGKSDAMDNSLPFPPGVHSSLKVTMPPLPPGIPVPVPVPVPGGPVFVEKHREPQRPSPGRDYGWNRHDNRDYRHNNSRWRYDRGRDWHPRPHGSVHRSLPVEAFALSVAGAAFFFHMGTYYRHTPTGYVVVQAPFGARVRVLPESCSTLYVDGRSYYNCDDVYYEPDGDEYVVIERPSGQYQAEVEVGDEVRVKAEFLNVRSGPGTRYRAVNKLYRGDIVEIGGIDGDWYYVRLSNGLYGWVMREHTRLHRSRQEVKG